MKPTDYLSYIKKIVDREWGIDTPTFQDAANASREEIIKRMPPELRSRVIGILKQFPTFSSESDFVSIQIREELKFTNKPFKIS